MSVIMIVFRHHSPSEQHFDTVREAIDSGLSDLEFNLGFPSKITENGQVIWDAETDKDDLFDFGKRYGSEA